MTKQTGKPPAGAATQYTLPAEIETASMEIIRTELTARGIRVPEDRAPVVYRVIHATADFAFAETLCFSEGAVSAGIAALQEGAGIVTDTNMAKAGISRRALETLGGEAVCFTADPAVSDLAKAGGTTRSAAAMEVAARQHPGAIRAIGNAPTALLKLAEQIETGLCPPLVIAAPVGFVNVVESKRRIVAVCREYGVPCIAAMGRKGGSTVAAAICNALLYAAAGWLDPEARDRLQNGITGAST